MQLCWILCYSYPQDNCLFHEQNCVLSFSCQLIMWPHNWNLVNGNWGKYISFGIVGAGFYKLRWWELFLVLQRLIASPLSYWAVVLVLDSSVQCVHSLIMQEAHCWNCCLVKWEPHLSCAAFAKSPSTMLPSKMSAGPYLKSRNVPSSWWLCPLWVRLEAIGLWCLDGGLVLTHMWQQSHWRSHSIMEVRCVSSKYYIEGHL